MDRWLGNINVVRVVAIVVGVLLWAIVRMDVQNSSAPSQPTTVTQTYTDVRVVVKGLNEDSFSLRSIEPQRVTMYVSGTPSALRRVAIQEYEIVADLSAARDGEQVVVLRKDGFPNNVDVVLDPQNVTVVLDQKQQKEVPVTLQLTGMPAEGFAAGDPIIRPNRVNVTVPSSSADEVASVTGEVDISGATELVKQQVRLIARNAAGEELDVAMQPAVVEVEVPITSPFKTVPLQIRLEGITPPGLAVGSFSQSDSEVTVYAPQAYLNSLEFYDGLVIDLSLLTSSREFVFDIPMKEAVDRLEPAKVQASVTIVEAVNRTIADVPLTLNGRSDEYEYEVVSSEDAMFEVGVEAAPEIAEGIEREDVQMTVNVSNIPAGVHELPVEYTLPSFVEPAAGNMHFVTVRITPKDEAAAAEPSAEPEEDGMEAAPEVEENPDPTG